MFEKFGLIGEFHLKLYDEFKRLKTERIIRNIIVDDGFDFLCENIGDADQNAKMGYVAVGDFSTVTGAASSTLSSELKRVTGYYDHTGGTKILTISGTFSAGQGTGSISDAGVFNSATAGQGTMLCRQAFAEINKGADDSLDLTWTLTLS